MRFVLIAIISLLTLVNSTILFTPLKSKQSFCLEEQLVAQILLKIKMNNTQPLNIIISYQNNVVHAQENLTIQNIFYTAPHTQIYKICWGNSGQNDAILGFQFNVGLKANDFQSTLDNDSHQRLINLALHGQTLGQSIFTTTKHFHLSLQKKLQAHEGLGFNSLILSILFITVAGTLLFFQHKAVKKQIQTKKNM